MSAVEFAQFGLRERIAPRSIGPVKARLRHATTVMRRRKWSANRVKDTWYADSRISPSADEIRDIEELTGLRYGREEIREIDDLIQQADALLEGADPDFHSPFVTAMRSFFRSLARPGIEGIEPDRSSRSNSGRAAE